MMDGMSQNTERPGVARRVREMLDQQVQAGLITAEQATKFLERYVNRVQTLPYPMAMAEFRTLAARLRNRQGTVLPDFEAFYREWDERDRDMFGKP